MRDVRRVAQARGAIGAAWLGDGDEYLRVARAVERLVGGDVGLVYDRTDEGRMGSVRHTFGGTGRVWSEICDPDALSLQARYRLDQLDRNSNRGVSCQRLFAAVPRRGREYRAVFLEPKGLAYQLRTAIFARSHAGPRFVAWVGACRAIARQAFGEREESLLDAIVPVLADTVDIARALGSRRPESAGALADVLEGLEQPAYVLTDAGHIVFANEVARITFPRVPAWLRCASVEGVRLPVRARFVPVVLEGRALRVVLLPATALLAPRPAQVATLASLPPWLARIAVLLADGLSDKDVALRTGLPLATVSTATTRIYRRLGVRGRRDLMRLASES